MKISHSFLRSLRRAALAVALAGASFAGVAHEGPAPVDAAADKLGRGIANLITGWMEIPKNIVHTYNDTNLPFAAFGGTIKGVVYGLGRMATGVFDMATFYVPTAPIVRPDVPWRQMETESRFGAVRPAGAGGDK